MAFPAIPSALALLAAASLAPSASAAEPFAEVTDQSEFVQLVSDKALVRFGIRLEVEPDGRIDGSAFGRDVSGEWRWSGRYFCRELFYGGKSLDGTNCQAVLRNGDTLRFVADEGTGDHADLRLR